ncbi:DUF1090 domain-containing protein [Pusillimonas sp. SM2304]|uniref:DUF1090 domain-containing protein n=1 Tax=Pusillimonas sp. SM2304 TaxID=3073241 RepID=UPI002876492A|nr:DUF1090 domain-containing protein [Pusillimonas sp. SM2304]MDS1141058.1 DUF1090 domain-containing protein [Pusillimonas sp. SM2304]
MVSKYLAGLVLLFGVAPAMAANPACERKAVEIAQQIKFAQEANNSQRQRGLEKALSMVQQHCTDAGLIKDQKQDIAEQQEEVDDILEEIQQKESEGRYDKVKKLQRKLEREQKELEVLKQELTEIEKA